MACTQKECRLAIYIIHLNNIYGIDISHALVSKITDRVLSLANE
ncbi:hypothetical protein BN170_1510038 [Clostridioides difficile T22]|nr:hypothetical protein BN170_1510038 [Clostridioides difficile T22]CCL17910.1 hypothetical protein BN171_1930022 [Clostridioides difficile E25]CCL24320.1 hypothetical protein BN172_5740007 [Clostridioides difficile T15]CCL42397.1 hypothetical protein BN177_430047 [Clostridioides difficile E24]CCL46244.1 hypothetical protein BN178_670047 [Clostridioides difficile T42]CCL48935.1 hypothetical protein BN179_1610025 [Clostridioides difficile T6]CCL52944.1 hypothetical protein BN180_1370025 [Clost